MPIRSDFPSFIMAFVIFLSGCCFICHEMEPRSVVNFMDALNKFTSGEVHLIRGKVVHFPPEKKRNGDKINIFGGKVHQKSGKMVHFPPKLSAGPKTCPAPETGTGTERERWKDAAPGSGECMRMAGGVGGHEKKGGPSRARERARCRWDLLIKDGGGLLSRPYGQYHRRWRA